ENTFRHVNIALVNELAVFAGQLGVDVWEAIEAASTKPFGFMRFAPGPGVGGHCLPVDPSYLSWAVRRNLGHQFRFIELANDVTAEEVAAADAVVVLTDHDDFDYGLVQRTASYVFDARNRCRGRQVERI